MEKPSDPGLGCQDFRIVRDRSFIRESEFFTRTNAAIGMVNDAEWRGRPPGHALIQKVRMRPRSFLFNRYYVIEVTILVGDGQFGSVTVWTDGKVKDYKLRASVPFDPIFGDRKMFNPFDPFEELRGAMNDFTNEITKPFEPIARWLSRKLW